MSATPPDPDAATPAPGDAPDGVPLPEIAGYRLLRVLGAGGMSTVYLGRQESLGREVAIKVMLPEALADEVSRRRFENEARTIARLEHPHIVGIFEVGRTRAGLPYYAMPYLARGHLGQREFAQDGHENGHARVRAILHALLSALDYAHARGVVHRDVKAENVLFDEAERPLLADFGIALRRGFGPRVTTAGMAVGSTAYMAPEQARGEEVDARADLYSVGVLAWEMLTGKLPYMAGDALSMAVMHAQDPIPRLPRPLRHWQRFLDKALAKSPAQRFHNAQRMREALDRVPLRGGQPLTRALAGVQRGLARVRHWPRAAWLAVLLLGAAGIGFALRQGGGDERFFRVPGAERSAPASPGLLGDITDPMLRPLPVSPAERWITAAEQQLRAHALTAPRGANAYDSLLAAWHADAGHPRLPAATAALLGAFAEQAERRIRSGDTARARDYVDRAAQLSAAAPHGDPAALAQLRARVAKALDARIADAAAHYDRDTALRLADSARALGLDAAASQALRARAQAIPRSGDALPGEADMRLVATGDGMIAVARSEVSHAEYARFASATGRDAALCRERLSPLRIVKPISWREPGFATTPGQPVVCVSWADADAYARWLSQRSGHRYRLPDAAEAGALPAGGGAKPVAEWLRECRDGCRERLTRGRSWRGGADAAREAARGYDDVGFRLVREL
ncbi:bifunctional serine/threonine-protein kinase/formylglycine-generating enzyme family protein [Cognatiluteimonas weifangensis]|nr:bifunctional serine/threonine-protein kinase/formylglycine-generating enzyme family protein [Luteimonas weifangensis]